MRLLSVLLMTCLTLALASCGKGDSDPSATDADAVAAGGDNDPSSKRISSIWIEENDLFHLDLRSAKLGVLSKAYITSNTVGSCTCDVLIQGSESLGTMSFSNCNNGSYGCVSLRPSGSYTKSSTTGLQLCTTTSCIQMD